jgi:hypothetical protein
MLLSLGLVLPLLLLEASLRLGGATRGSWHGPEFDRERYDWFGRAAARSQPPETSGDELRIAVIGDSFTAGDGVGWLDAYPARLERLLNLNAGAPFVRVSVYAAKGASTWDELRLLRRALEDDPDIVLLGLFINDPEDRRDSRLEEWRRRLVPTPPRDWWATLTNRSAALRWVHYRFQKVRAAKAGRDYYRYLFDADTRHWRRFRQALRRFSRETRRRGVTFCAVIFPGMVHLGAGYPNTYAHEQIARALTESEIRHLDLLPEFADKAPFRMSAIPGVDGHPSEIAHRIAARAILAWWIREDLLPAGVVPARGPDLTPHYEVLYRKLQPSRFPPWELPAPE